MKIGVTGGTGFIGQYLMRDYSNQYNFLAATSHPDWARKSTHSVQYVTSDYSYESFRQIFSDCDAIVHLGGNVPESIYGLGKISEYTANLYTSENLFRAAVDLGIKKIINVSSSSIYDKALYNSIIGETQKFAPSNIYGIAKATVEMMANAYSKIYDINVVNLRISQVIGDKKFKKACFFSMLEENAYNNKAITIYGTGRAARDIVYVKDVTYAINCSLLSGKATGSYNIGSGKSTSNLELAKAFVTGFNSESEIVFIPVECEDSWDWRLDISKAQHELGYFPQYNLLSMTKDIKEEMQVRRSHTL